MSRPLPTLATVVADLARVLGALGILVGAGGITAAILTRRTARTTAGQ